MPRGKIDGQPAYVLHAYPFRETSLIIEVFTRDFGRVALLARGARRPRSAIRGLLMAFQPLELGWSGKGDVLTLMKVEWVGGQPPLGGDAIFCGYYLNELLIQLLPREDAHPGLFLAYERVLGRLVLDPDGRHQEVHLRLFEKSMLQELGYGLTLDVDGQGQVIDAQALYAFRVGEGVQRVQDYRDSPVVVAGQTLLDLAHERFSGVQAINEAKQLMRILISHYLGGAELQTRRVFMELQNLRERPGMLQGRGKQ